MNIRKQAHIAVWTAIVAALTLGAQAEEKAPNEKPDKAAFNTIDTNQDGQITLREASENNGWLTMNFNVVDENRDGRVTKAEFEKALS